MVLQPAVLPATKSLPLIEQLVVRRRVGQRKVVHRVDDADAEVVAPDPVREAASEERVVFLAHPVEQDHARIFAGLHLDGGAAQRFRAERTLVLRIG